MNHEPNAHTSAFSLSYWGRICGAISIVLFVSCPLTFLLTLDTGLLLWGKVALGTLLLAFYLITNRDFFARIAGSRSTGLLALSTLSVMLTFGFVLGANYLAYTHPYEKDLTQEHLYTFSDQTHKILAQLAQDIDIYAFYGSHEQRYPAVDEILSRYHFYSPHIHYHMVDPQARPDLVEQYQITDRGPRIIVATPTQNIRIKEPTENELTNALIKTREKDKQKIYFVTGHQEADTQDSNNVEGAKLFFDAVAQEGYQVEELNFRVQQAEDAPKRTNIHTPKDAPAHKLQVPQDAAALILLAPKTPLFAPEVEALTQYVEHGGRLMLCLEPHQTPVLNELLQQWHIEVHDDLIVDPNPLNRLLGLGVAVPMVQPIQSDHPIVQGLNTPVVMPTARSLYVHSDGQKDIAAQPLALTTETAWGETHLQKDGTAEKDSQDYTAPLFVAMSAAYLDDAANDDAEHQARLLVFGDGDWLSNKYLHMQGNQDFALNSVNWLAQKEDRITIRPKIRQSSQLYLTGDQINRIKFVTMDMLPVIIVAIGLGITLSRRQR